MKKATATRCWRTTDTSDGENAIAQGEVRMDKTENYFGVVVVDAGCTWHWKRWPGARLQVSMLFADCAPSIGRLEEE
jgi:hypothetical protein